MVCLYLLLQKRKFLRNCVTTEFHKLKHDIPISPIEIKRIKCRVEQVMKDLDHLDAEILNLKFPEDSEYSMLEKEFLECEDYINKCQEIIATLDTIEIEPPFINAPHLYTRYNMPTLTETNNHIGLVNEFREEIVCNLSSEILNKFLLDDHECKESEFDNTVTHSETNGHVQLTKEDFVCNLSYEILDEISVNIEETNEKGDSFNMITHTEETHNDEVVNEFGEVVLYSSSHIIFDENLVRNKKVHEKSLNVVTLEALRNQYCRNTSLYVNTSRNDNTEKNEHLVHFTFQNGEKDSINESIMPLFLGCQAYYLSSEIKNLNLMKQVIRSQENEDVVKEIKNFKYLRKECLETSPLPFMNGDKIDSKVTKGNVDLLPNTCENLFIKVTIFPNQTPFIPNLSHKIESYLIHLTSKLPLEDYLKKAFNTIGLIGVDQIQLLCLFESPPKTFYTVKYHSLRLCFDVYRDPTILLILVSLYILNFNVGNNVREMKKLKSFLYLLYYMSNGTPPNNGKESSLVYSIIHSNSKPCFFGLHFFIINLLLVDKLISIPYLENYSPIDEFLELQWESPRNVLRITVPTSCLNPNIISSKNQTKYILNIYQIGNHQYFESTIKYSQFPLLDVKPKHDISFISKLKLKLINQLPFDRGKVHICPNSVEHDTTSLFLSNKVPMMQWKNDQSQKLFSNAIIT